MIKKIDEHIPCGYAISIIWVPTGIKDKRSVYRRKKCMKKFCESLKEHAVEIRKSRKENKIMSLIIEQQESYGKTNICYICGEKFKEEYHDNEKYRKVKD